MAQTPSAVVQCPSVVYVQQSVVGVFTKPVGVWVPASWTGAQVSIHTRWLKQQQPGVATCSCQIPLRNPAGMLSFKPAVSTVTGTLAVASPLRVRLAVKPISEVQGAAGMCSSVEQNTFFIGSGLAQKRLRLLQGFALPCSMGSPSQISR